MVRKVDFIPFQNRLMRYGFYNSLAQVLIKTLAPGIPDFYQGTELWDWSLVDPDNRRPVDYALRQQRLTELQESQKTTDWLKLVHTLLENPEDGRIKLFITTIALQFRKKHSSIFLKGSYLPLQAEGERAETTRSLRGDRGHGWRL